MGYYAVSVVKNKDYVIVHRFNTMQDRNKWSNARKNRSSIRSDSPIVGRAMKKRDKIGFPILSISPQKVMLMEYEMNQIKKTMELERYLKTKDRAVSKMDDASEYLQYRKEMEGDSCV